VSTRKAERKSSDKSKKSEAIKLSKKVTEPAVKEKSPAKEVTREKDLDESDDEEAMDWSSPKLEKTKAPKSRFQLP
jgi:hypothetical protein